MYKRRQTTDEWGFVGDIAKIALGVFIGIMSANAAEEAIAKWRLEQASKQMLQELNAMKESERRAEQHRLQQQKDQQDQQRRLQLERDLQRQQRDLAVKRKEQAWANFYQPSYTCRLDALRADCADAHIKAKRAFEAQYKDN